MIWAEIRGKLAPTAALSMAERWEDVLTSSVFGLLRYLPDEIMLRFLGQAVKIDGDRLCLPAGTLGRFEVFFWPSLPDWRREPDVVIDAFDRSSRLLRRIVIEAKYKSGKSQRDSDDVGGKKPDQVEMGDQLADQLCAAWLDHKRDVVVAEEPPALIYLTSHFATPEPDITQSLHALQKKEKDVPPEIYWLAWWKLTSLLKTAVVQTPLKRIVDDLVALLARRNQSLLFDAWCSRPPDVEKWDFESRGVARWWGSRRSSFLRPRWRFERGPAVWFDRTAQTRRPRWKFKT